MTFAFRVPSHHHCWLGVSFELADQRFCRVRALAYGDRNRNINGGLDSDWKPLAGYSRETNAAPIRNSRAIACP
jgi:hypothetical protein